MACRQIDDSEESLSNENGSSLRRSIDHKSCLNEAQAVLSEEDVMKILKARKLDMDYLASETRVVLIGKSGVGKSATGNTIIGQDCFKSEFGAGTVTKECSKIQTQFRGKNILVVDTPGIFDTETDPDIIQEEIRKCIKIAAPGPHVVLFVMSLRDRYKREDYEALTKFCSYFGEKLLDHVIIVFTHADTMQDHSITFDAHIDDSPSQLKELLQCFGNRKIAFNNKCSFKQRESQVANLLTMIDALKTRNITTSYYFDLNFEIAEKEKQHMEKEIDDSLREKYSEMTKKFHRDCEAEFEKKWHRLQIECGIKTSEDRRNVRKHESTEPRPAMEVTGLQMTLHPNSIAMIPKPNNFAHR